MTKFEKIRAEHNATKAKRGSPATRMEALCPVAAIVWEDPLGHWPGFGAMTKFSLSFGFQNTLAISSDQSRVNIFDLSYLSKWEVPSKRRYRSSTRGS